MSERRSVVTLGTFDGVHRGHQRILRKVVDRAKRLKARSVVLAFGMPPRLGHTPRPRPVLLTTLADKLQILKRLGIDQTEILKFDRTTKSTPPETFFTRRILAGLKAREMVVGPRVAFGKDRAGKLPLLKRLGRRYKVQIYSVPGVHVDGQPVSSSRIRQLLFQGDVAMARRLLGYPYSIAGRVTHGAHRGRRMGYPTANIQAERTKILPPGVFWVKCLSGTAPAPWNDKDLRAGVDGLCNVGTRPTFTPHDSRLHCEVYLFKKPGNLYGKPLRVVFLRRIRSEKRFTSAQALKNQIARDFNRAQKWSSGAAK